MKISFSKVIIASLIFSTLNVFAESAAKKVACDAYLNSDYSQQPTDVQIDVIAELLNTAYELKYNPEQMTKLKDKFKSVLAINPKKIDAFHGNAYFACTTELSEEDLQAASEEFAAVVK